MARPRTRTLVVAGAAIALVVAAAIPAAIVLRGRADRERMRAAAEAFATAWRTGRLETVGYGGASGAEVARLVAAATAGLTPAAQDRPARVDLLALDATGSDRARERLRVRWDLAPGRVWEYETSAALVRSGGAWQVAWEPSIVHPQLAEGQVLSARRVPAERGQILGAGGQVLVTARPVVIVGIVPARAADPRAAAAAVASIVGVDAAALAKRVAAAAPGAFVDVITLRRADYEAVRARLQPIPGAVFRETALSLAPTATFARALLGTVGPATAEIVKESGGRVQAGDFTGLSGIQRRYDARLAGTPGITVTAGPPSGAASAPASPSATAGSSASPSATAGSPALTLHTVAPLPGQPVRLSLSESVQRTAETVLASAQKPAALVALRPSTGEVLAVANGPASAAGYNRALIGRYPPGSTFKISTTFALLADGLSAGDPVACPPTINVGGRVFKNAEGEALGTVPFRTDFAQSCNTAFVGLSRRITAEQLFRAATTLGYGRPNLLGADAFTGSVPRSAGPVEHAADAIGQGTVLASPLTVATVSASVASGTYLPPRLVLEPPAPAAPDDAGGNGGASPSPSATALPAGTITQLRTLTGLVVTSGTGTALRGVPGEPVHGKTGTAEFGAASPPETHAWFTGYQGDLAFAIVVEGGGFGGKVAAPLAVAFLRSLA